jgi:hypothetical protein
MKLQQQRQHIEELLGCLAELEERYSLLDEENGELQDQLFATKRQVGQGQGGGVGSCVLGQRGAAAWLLVAGLLSAK